jgi:hypothetical protein
LLRALAGVLAQGGEIVFEPYGWRPAADASAIEVHEPGDVYARDDFVYWGFSPEGLRRLGRIVGLDEVGVVDELEVDGHPRLRALLTAPWIRGHARLLATNQPMPAPAEEPGQTSEPWLINARDRSTVEGELAPAARILSPSPNVTDGATCATRREAGATGFDCGAGAVLLRALPHRPGGRVPI